MTPPRRLQTRTQLAVALLAVPVATELVWHPFGDHRAGMTVLALAQLGGWSLLAGVVRRLGRMPALRRARRSRGLVLAGCVVQAAFAAAYLVAAQGGDDAPGPVWVLFLLGFVLLGIGGVRWGMALRRSAATVAGRWLVLVAALGLLAVGVPTDPFHDVFLLSGYLAWVPFVRAASHPVQEHLGTGDPAPTGSAETATSGHRRR